MRARRAHLEALSQRLINDGKIIEGGWVGLRLAVLPLNAPAAQLDDMRLAFMAGAQHLFASVTLDPEVSQRRMQMIAEELEAFDQEIKQRANTHEDSALTCFRRFPTKR